MSQNVPIYDFLGVNITLAYFTTTLKLYMAIAFTTSVVMLTEGSFVVI